MDLFLVRLFHSTPLVCTSFLYTHVNVSLQLLVLLKLIDWGFNNQGIGTKRAETDAKAHQTTTVQSQTGLVLVVVVRNNNNIILLTVVCARGIFMFSQPLN